LSRGALYLTSLAIAGTSAVEGIVRGPDGRNPAAASVASDEWLATHNPVIAESCDWIHEMKDGRITASQPRILRTSCSRVQWRFSGNVSGPGSSRSSGCCGNTGSGSVAPLGVGGAGGLMDHIDGHLKFNLDLRQVAPYSCYVLRVNVTDSSTGDTSYEDERCGEHATN
jgi:hypothetical protein